MPDLTSLQLPELGLGALLALLFLVVLLEVGWNIVLALAHGDFSAAYVATFLKAHVLLRAFPIAGAAVLGNGIPILQVPAIAIVYLGAEAGLTAYLVETVGSMWTATKDTKPS